MFDRLSGLNEWTGWIEWIKLIARHGSGAGVQEFKIQEQGPVSGEIRKPNKTQQSTQSLVDMIRSIDR